MRKTYGDDEAALRFTLYVLLGMAIHKASDPLACMNTSSTLMLKPLRVREAARSLWQKTPRPTSASPPSLLSEMCSIVQFRFPKTAIDQQALQPYYYGVEEIELSTVGQHAILNIGFQEEGGEWVEGEGQLASLAPLRDLAIHRGQRAAFDARLRNVLAPYAGSAALQRRLREKRLVE